MLDFARQARLLLFCFLVSCAGSVTAQDTVYEIAVLNSGLGPAPEVLDRSSPHATIEALLDFAKTGNFAEAAHLLNLATVSKTEQLEEGPKLSEQLYSIIDRKIVISWSELLDRPDALDAGATTKSAVAGQARKSILLGVLTIEDRPYPLYLDRVKVGDADPVWVFSERSVANIGTVYAAYGPSEMERKLPDWARKDVFWNLMWWEVIGLPIMLFIAGLSGFFAHRTLSRAAEAADRDFVTKVVVASRLPLVIFVITSIISIISGIFVFSGPIATFVSPVVALGYVLTALILVVNVVDRIIDQLVELDDVNLKQMGEGGRRETATKVSLARRMMIVVIVLVGFGVVLSEANVFRTFGFSLLASAGAVTLLLGFAAREVLSNIMSSMQIALNQSARIGDKVVYKGHICNVERINFTYVLLRVWTGVRLVVPVTEFVSETFENWTIKEPEMLRLIEIRVSHAAQIETLRKIFFKVLDEIEQEELGAYESQQVRVTGHNVFGQIVTFCLSCANPNTSWALSCEVRERLIENMQKLENSGSAVFPEVSPAEGE